MILQDDRAKTQSKHSHDDIESKVEETGQDAIPPLFWSLQKSMMMMIQ